MTALNLSGRTLDDKYSVQSEIGRGGMGAVYRAVHLGTKRPVAVKVIAPQLMQHREFVERFKREAEAAGRLHHPNVVDVTDFGIAETIEGRVAYLVMEYLKGCTLAEVLREEKTLSLLWTVDILEQVCLAVAEAHWQGIIHRDLKPDNIWLAPNERGGYTVKVLDFGIAKLESPSAEFSVEKINSNFVLDDDVKSEISKSAGEPTALFFQNESPPTKTGYETFIESIGENPIPKPFNSLTPQMNPVNDSSVSQMQTLADPRAIPRDNSLFQLPRV